MSEPVDLDQEPTPDAPAAPVSPWADLDAYVALPRPVSLDVSPDGRWLLAGIQTLTSDATAHTTALWRIPTDGGPARRLTRGVEGEQATCLLRDGSVVFTAKRSLPPAGEDEHGEDGALWCLPSGGGEAHVLARRRGGWGTVLAARTADRLLAAPSIHVGTETLAEDSSLRAEREKKKVRALLHEGSGVRYWDHDLPTATVRLATVDVDTSGTEPSTRRDAIRLTTGTLGRALTDDVALSGDGSFAVATVDEHLPRGDRRSRLVRVDLASGGATDLLADAVDGYESPVLSPDDRLVACVRYVASDPTTAPHLFLHVADLATGEHHDVAATWPRWGDPVAFSPDGSTLYVVADEDGDAPVFAVDLATDEVRRLTGHGAFSSVRLAPDGSTLYAIRSSWDVQPEVVAIDAAAGEVRTLDAPLPRHELPGRVERVSTTTDDGTRVPGWLCLPAGASATSPAPLVLWIHGGPLNSWNAWSWRWCPWLLVSQGHAVLLPDPALSTGYGRDFIQRGWGAWGDKPYTDLMAITDAVEQRDDVDASRTAAMGGSFGGYMANWVAGHTDRFRCIVTHASLWNLPAFGATTDAPWYWGREMSPEMVQANSPHLFADAISTPMLVVHGDKDYRVPIGEGLGLWWALVSGFDGPEEDLPHKFLYFPDENHWVLSPQHAVVWYRTVRAFLATHLDGVAFERPGLL